MIEYTDSYHHHVKYDLKVCPLVKSVDDKYVWASYVFVNVNNLIPICISRKPFHYKAHDEKHIAPERQECLSRRWLCGRCPLGSGSPTRLPLKFISSLEDTSSFHSSSSLATPMIPSPRPASPCLHRNTFSNSSSSGSSYSNSSSFTHNSSSSSFASSASGYIFKPIVIHIRQSFSPSFSKAHNLYTLTKKSTKFLWKQ